MPTNPTLKPCQCHVAEGPGPHHDGFLVLPGNAFQVQSKNRKVQALTVGLQDSGLGTAACKTLAPSCSCALIFLVIEDKGNLVAFHADDHDVLADHSWCRISEHLFQQYVGGVLVQ